MAPARKRSRYIETAGDNEATFEVAHFVQRESQVEISPSGFAAPVGHDHPLMRTLKECSGLVYA
jgi:hypothetical protein